MINIPLEQGLKQNFASLGVYSPVCYDQHSIRTRIETLYNPLRIASETYCYDQHSIRTRIETINYCQYINIYY